MKRIILFSFLIISAFSNAQVKFFVEASGNMSLISSSQANLTTEVRSDKADNLMFLRENFSAKYKNKLGGGITAGLQYFFQEDKISLDAGLDFNNVNFHQTLQTAAFYVYQSTKDYVFTVAESPLPTNKEDASNHSLLLLSLPLSISYYFLENNLSVGIGALPGLLVYGSGGKGASSDFNKTMMGIQIQLRYQFAPKIWVMGGFQEYSTKLYKPELKQSFSNLRMVKLGLKYDL